MLTRFINCDNYFESCVNTHIHERHLKALLKRMVQQL